MTMGSIAGPTIYCGFNIRDVATTQVITLHKSLNTEYIWAVLERHHIDNFTRLTDLSSLVKFVSCQLVTTSDSKLHHFSSNDFVLIIFRHAHIPNAGYPGTSSFQRYPKT